MNTKQLKDLISLSVLAVMSENDPTQVPRKVEGDHTPFMEEVFHITNNLELAKALNEHIAAIRLGMRLKPIN